jgi:hypothetical protein
MTQKSIKRTIILVNGNFNTIKKMCSTHKEYLAFSWRFLSRDALLYMKLRDFFHNDDIFVPTGDTLQQIARQHRQEYIDFIGTMSHHNNPLSWWLTSVSEKNPFISQVFLNFCYLKVIERNLDSYRDMVIICDSRPLMYSIRDTFSDHKDCSIQIIDSRIGQITERISGFISGMEKKTFYAIRFICRIVIAKLYASYKGHKNVDALNPTIAIDTWTDARSFLENSTYRDVYFGELGRRVKERDPHSFYISNVLPTVLYPRAVSKISQCNEKIYLFEEFLTIADVFRTIIHVFSQIPRNVHISKLCDMDISPLIHDELSNDRYRSSRSENALLYYYAGQRMAMGGKIKTLIYPFENHMWEKMLCQGIRKSGSGIKLVGYAHTIVCPMYLFYSLSDSEQAIASLPDMIMVNGRRSMDILRDSGFSHTTIIISGAFRYEHVIKKEKSSPLKQSHKTILVVPTAGFNETIELLDKVVQTFKDSDDITINIKLHPTLPITRILPVFPHLPNNFRFCDSRVEQLLDTADLVLYTESAVSIEALSRHIPILHIKSELRIDMNLLEGIDWIGSVSRHEDILSYSRVLLDYKGESGEKFDDLVSGFFSPVNENIEAIL